MAGRRTSTQEMMARLEVIEEVLKRKEAKEVQLYIRHVSMS